MAVVTASPHLLFGLSVSLVMTSQLVTWIAVVDGASFLAVPLPSNAEGAELNSRGPPFSHEDRVTSNETSTSDLSGGSEETGDGAGQNYHKNVDVDEEGDDNVQIQEVSGNTELADGILLKNHRDRLTGIINNIESQMKELGFEPTRATIKSSQPQTQFDVTQGVDPYSVNNNRGNNDLASALFKVLNRLEKIGGRFRAVNELDRSPVEDRDMKDVSYGENCVNCHAGNKRLHVRRGFTSRGTNPDEVRRIRGDNLVEWKLKMKSSVFDDGNETADTKRSSGPGVAKRFRYPGNQYGLIGIT